MPSSARFSRSIKKARLRPTIAAKVNVTQSAPGATSTAPTAVGSRAKNNTDSTSTANASDETSAVLVRHSTARSFAAMATMARMVSATDHQLPVALDDRIHGTSVAWFQGPQPPFLEEADGRHHVQQFGELVRRDRQRPTAIPQARQDTEHDL